MQNGFCQAIEAVQILDFFEVILRRLVRGAKAILTQKKHNVLLAANCASSIINSYAEDSCIDVTPS